MGAAPCLCAFLFRLNRLVLAESALPEANLQPKVNHVVKIETRSRRPSQPEWGLSGVTQTSVRGSWHDEHTCSGSVALQPRWFSWGALVSVRDDLVDSSGRGDYFARGRVS